jgi:hypothetical protein
MNLIDESWIDYEGDEFYGDREYERKEELRRLAEEDYVEFWGAIVPSRHIWGEGEI